MTWSHDYRSHDMGHIYIHITYIWVAYIGIRHIHWTPQHARCNRRWFCCLTQGTDQHIPLSVGINGRGVVSATTNAVH